MLSGKPDFLTTLFSYKPWIGKFYVRRVDYVEKGSKRHISSRFGKVLLFENDSRVYRLYRTVVVMMHYLCKLLNLIFAYRNGLFHNEPSDTL